MMMIADQMVSHSAAVSNCFNFLNLLKNV